jgi:hypothetical protein
MLRYNKLIINYLLVIQIVNENEFVETFELERAEKDFENLF